MAKRNRVRDDEIKLESFSTKLEKQTKDMLVALVKVQGLDGQRELINEMLQLYCEKYPEVAEKATAMGGKPQKIY